MTVPLHSRRHGDQIIADFRVQVRFRLSTCNRLTIQIWLLKPSICSASPFRCPPSGLDFSAHGCPIPLHYRKLASLSET